MSVSTASRTLSPTTVSHPPTHHPPTPASPCPRWCPRAAPRWRAAPRRWSAPWVQTCWRWLVEWALECGLGVLEGRRQRRRRRVVGRAWWLSASSPASADAQGLTGVATGPGRSPGAVCRPGQRGPRPALRRWPVPSASGKSQSPEARLLLQRWLQNSRRQQRGKSALAPDRLCRGRAVPASRTLCSLTRHAWLLRISQVRVWLPRWRV